MSSSSSGSSRRPNGNGAGRSDLTDPLAARARHAAAAVRQRAPGAPGDGLEAVVARASRPRTPAVLAVVLLAVAVPVAVWSAATRTGEVQFGEPPPAATPTDPATVEPLQTPTPTPTPTGGETAAPDATEPATPSPGGSPSPPQASPGPGADDPAPPAPAQEPTADPGATEAPPPAVTVPPVGGFGTDPVVDGGFPDAGGQVAHLTDVRVARQDGFDRIVLEFDGPDVPSYRVAYADPPIVADGSGEEIPVEGVAFLQIVVTPASGVRSDDSAEGFTATYTGPQRVRGGTTVVTEVVRTGDFEATLGWVAGLRSPAPFAVRVLSAPLRLVIDVQHP